MAAFRLAAAGGADIIELDVRLTSDGHVVVIHDGWLRRTSNGWGIVARKKLAELKTLDAGSWFAPQFAGEPIPTLAEVLAWARDQDPRMALMIELKGEAQALKRGLAEKSVQLVAGCGMSDDVIFISFYHPLLSRVKAVAPAAIATGTIFKLGWLDRLLALVLRRRPNLEQASLVRRWLLRPLLASQAVGANSLSIPATALTASLIEATHAAGLAVSPGGVRWDYPAVIALGADTISTENPATVRAAFLSS
jgi:glycerophosphoryl diester phosphodiesterase